MSSLTEESTDLSRSASEKLVQQSASTLPIVETFHSVQGEGVWTGASAFFIRLAGCDVGCPWCDTKHSWPIDKHPYQSIDSLVEQVQSANPATVVVTGGEPLIHNLEELTSRIQQAGFRAHLETSGSHPFSGSWDWVTLSPKRFKPPLSIAYQQASELKIVIQSESDLEWAEQQAAKVDAQTVLYLQPEWNSTASKSLIFDHILKNRHWNLSLQTHKLIGVE